MILLCPSAHGLGHRARMVVLRDALRALGHDAMLAEDALPDAPLLDAGALLWNAREAGNASRAVERLRERWPSDVDGWSAALRALQPARVLVDVDPAPLAAARATGIPAAIVSNFTWADLVGAWGDEEGARWLASVYDDARAFSIPFALAMRGAGRITRVPHLARMPAPGEPDARTIVVAMGRGNPAAPGALLVAEPVDVVLAADASPLRIQGPARVRTTERIAEEIGHAALVVTKGGYSTVAECIAARCPMVLVPRDGPEDALMAQALAAAGVARVVAPGQAIRLPSRTQREAMRAAYARADAGWMTCDPIAAARIILEG